MEINKIIKTDCVIEQVTAISKNGKPYTTYRVRFSDFSINPIYLSTFGNKSGYVLKTVFDILGDSPTRS